MSKADNLAKAEKNLAAYVTEFLDGKRIERDPRVDRLVASAIAEELQAEVQKQEKLIRNPVPK
jgi:hypothetical protein